jgi:hypothetical protein
MVMPAKGDTVVYRSFAGDVYDAEVIELGADGRVDVEVTIPGLKAENGKMRLRAIRWYDDPKEPSPGARPKVAA